MINKILNEIFNCRTEKRRENIDDLKEIYKILGNPCKNIKFIHIAGTNGKGSTASFLENIFIEAGYNVGKFTSPHILSYNERIIANKNMITDAEIIKFYPVVLEAIKKYHSISTEKHNLNFFEITFFIALLYFETQKLDFIMLETGLGGRLDATNIINSNIALITNVSFDHTAILGNSLQEIAFEKAGIIKDNQLCFYAQNSQELEFEISKKTNNFENVLQKDKFNITLNTSNFETIITIDNFTFNIPLFGKFQAYNFLLAYYTAKYFNINNETIQLGLRKVKWQARFEIFSKNPTVILDAAHNDDSIQKLSENLMEIYKKEEIIIITSILETKNIDDILPKLQNISNKLFITSLKDITYGLTSQEIKEKMILKNLNTKNIHFEDDILAVYNKAIELVNKKETPYKAIVICGSFYEISKFKILINKL